MGYPILEFDEDPDAVIQPHALLPRDRLPLRGVACFFQEVMEEVCASKGANELHRLTAEHGTQPIYELEYSGERLAVFHPGVGGPLAAGWLEEVIAMGSAS